MTNDHVVLLGDLKGTRSMLGDYIAGYDQELTAKISAFRRIFTRILLGYLDRSRSMDACAFSDSVLVQWSDAIEGARLVVPLARDLGLAYQSADLPARLFADLGMYAPSPDDMGDAMTAATGRYSALFPVSTAVWSVFLAEANHFPNGVFVGQGLASRITSPTVQSPSEVLVAGPFKFLQLDLEAP
jgi:hypothetical protein